MTEYYVQVETFTGKWSVTSAHWFKQEATAKLNTVYNGNSIYVESPSIILALLKGKRLIEDDEKYTK